MNSPIIRKLASAILGLLLLFYIGYQIYTTNYKEIQTETATYASTSQTVPVTGIAIRQESVISSQLNGVVDYVIPDGGKVAKGGTVAKVYTSTQGAAAQKQLENLDSAITKLQKLSMPGNTYAADLDFINKQINLKLVETLEKVNSYEYAGLAQSKEDFLYLVNERQIVTHKSENFNTRINELKSQRDTLAASLEKAVGSVTSPAAGYFISSVDGFETAFDYSKVLSLTPAELKQKQQIKPDVPADAVGKVCTDYYWYFAFNIDIGQIAEFKLGDTVSVQFPFASSQTVPAKVAAVNQSPKESLATVVLQSDWMNSSIAAIRNETAQIHVQQYSGIRVSQKAIHFAKVTKNVKDKDGKTTSVMKQVKGVYVMHGSEIRFKQIFPLYSTENYVICDTEPPEEDLMTDTTVQLSDEVVVEGTDLYDGKVVK